MRKIPFKFVKVDKDPDGMRTRMEGDVPVYSIPRGISGNMLAERKCLKTKAKRGYGFNGKYPTGDRILDETS